MIIFRPSAVFAALALWACIVVLPPPCRSQELSQIQMMEPWQTVELEHEDRKARLRRLSVAQGISPPEFYEYSITPEEHHLAAYPTNIPVLRVVFQDQVFFDFNQDEVKPEASDVLDTIANSLRKEPPDVTVFIAGHTDSVGGVDYNLGLGLRRAKAVATALAQLGIARAQLYVVSFGKAVPIDTNDTDEGRARNRRVEFLFAARPEPVAAWLIKQATPTCSVTAYGDDCPTYKPFVALSVSISKEAAGVDETSKPSLVHLDHHSSAVSVAHTQQTVSFGDKVVDIDLRHKVYVMRAPE